jgi:hypothetical protein
MKKLILPIIAASIALSAPSFAASKSAAPDCGNAPQAKWMTKDAISALATKAGLKVRSVKVLNGCYEVYAMDKAGKKVEDLFHPVTGARLGNAHAG